MILIKEPDIVENDSNVYYKIILNNFLIKSDIDPIITKNLLSVIVIEMDMEQANFFKFFGGCYR